jgi:hypothetical protein
MLAANDGLGSRKALPDEAMCFVSSRVACEGAAENKAASDATPPRQFKADYTTGGLAHHFFWGGQLGSISP